MVQNDKLSVATYDMSFQGIILNLMSAAVDVVIYGNVFSNNIITYTFIDRDFEGIHVLADYPDPLLLSRYREPLKDFTYISMFTILSSDE